MKHPIKIDYLPHFTMGCSILGFLLQVWLHATGYDQRGLLVQGHPATILTFLLAVVTVISLFLWVHSMGHPPAYDQLFPQSRLAFAGSVAAAAGIVLISLLELRKFNNVTLLSFFLGLLAAASLVLLGLHRLKQTHPPMLLHTVVTVYMMLHVVSQYRVWSSETQPQLYIFQLLASVFLILASYHRTALDGRAGRRDLFVFCDQAALFFCCLSLVSDNWLFYLTMAFWTGTNLCTLHSVKKPVHQKIAGTMFLPGSVRHCIRRLEQSGFQAYAVGGCVRDSLLDLTPSDYDLCTNATPEQIRKVFADYSLVRNGEKHGTVGVILEGGIYEITTFRTESTYTDGRHPDSVTFVNDLESDLRRRDFTVNAMAYAPGKGFIDPWGGQKDLENRILRAVGDPETRFREDALRILRGVRFAVRFRLTPDEETLRAMIRLAPTMDSLARERVFSELCKLLPDLTAEDMHCYAPILTQIIPELAPTVGFDQHSPHHAYDIYTHTANVVQAVPKDVTLRWAALLHDLGKVSTFTQDENGRGHFYGHAQESARIAKEILLRLKAPTALREQVVLLISQHMSPLTPDKKLLRRKLGAWGEEGVRQLLTLQKADFCSKGVQDTDMITPVQVCLEELLAESPCLTVKDLAVTGQDMLSLGIAPGPIIGQCMHYLLLQVQNELLPNEKKALMQAANDFFTEKE